MLSPRAFPGLPLARAGFILLIVGFYFWTSLGRPLGSYIKPEADGYYNLLTRGITKGHLYLDIPADPYLRTLPNPWDPDARGTHGVSDASYFRGHYYIYFGVSPVLLLFLPFHALSGHYIDEALAVALFTSGGFILSVILLCALRDRYLPSAPALVEFSCLAALGLANMTPVMLRRAALWEVPLSCGYVCAMLALLSVYLAVHRKRAWPWMALGGLALGFAVGSRPLYLLVSPVLLIPLWLRWSGNALEGAGKPGAIELLATFLPISVVGAVLATYNQLRFHSPFEFGLRYQMWNEDPAKTVRFAWRFAVYNVHAYLTTAANWSHYFPFVNRVSLPPTPANFYGEEDVYGLFPNMPFVLLGFGCLILLLGRPKPAETAFRWMVSAIAWAGLVMTGIMLFFQAALNRYMMDFTPALVLLAAVGALLISQHTRRTILVQTLIVLLAAYSCLFNVLAGFRHNELFRINRPAEYHRIARIADWIPEAIDRLHGVQYGPLELKVVFPIDGKPGANEPLVVTGETFLSDYLYVHYEADGRVSFGLIHTSGYAEIGPTFRPAPGVVHTVVVDLPSLYPPADSPYFSAMDEGRAAYLQRTTRVTLDGEIALGLMKPVYESTGPNPLIGTDRANGAFPNPFSGKILSARRLEPPAPARPMAGLLRIKLTLPVFTQPTTEPLASLGQTGRNGVVSISQVSDGAMHLDYTAADGRVVHGPVIEGEPGIEQSIEFEDGASGMTVRVNSIVALQVPGEETLGEAYIGVNTPKIPDIDDTFGGKLGAISHGDRPASDSYGPLRIRYKVPAITGPRNEPLVCTGATGRGDLVYIRYEAPGRVSFGFDHWGVGGLATPSIQIDPTRFHTIDIDFAALDGPAPATGKPQGVVQGRLRISVDGTLVYDGPQESYVVEPSTISVGSNPIGASTATDRTTGVLGGFQRVHVRSLLLRDGGR